ncbi:hypothetical protein R3W88_008266 [Solanum pinnatisectum]|uniref:Acyl-[acyl-carrier-protein] desaturase n=1 Tax=Solanum pinnatisectum TaxID=50273 RepID=A0AAV9M7G5_9SOLN|nr:hypothetical protein R3W88_008266 [Solanum pinnatisectum]
MALNFNSPTFQSIKTTRRPSSSLRSPRVFMASTLRPPSVKVEMLRSHSSSTSACSSYSFHAAEKREIFDSLHGWAENNILVHLKPAEKCWRAVQGNSDDYFVVLVGDMITEEALPTYRTMLNTLYGVRDETGSSHENNPYLGFIYTSFQERATFISHGNTARHAKEHGDMKLAFDPDGTVLAILDMMRKNLDATHLMYDGRDDNLFEHFSAVAQRLGVYTAKDYAYILEFLVGRWEIEIDRSFWRRTQSTRLCMWSRV